MFFFSSFLPDIDNNGFLDKNDFVCLAVRNTLIEGRGEFPAEAYANNQKIMNNLWNEIAELADFNKVKLYCAIGRQMSASHCQEKTDKL